MIIHVNYIPQPRTAVASELLATLFAFLAEGRVDPSLLARLRIHLDWIQYRSNFREAVIIRRPFTQRAETFPLAELAIDVRQARPETFRDELARAFARLKSPEAAETPGRVILEGFVPCRASVIWAFNRLFWQHLSAWEAATGRSYEQALPGGKSDANHPDAVADSVTEFWALLKELETRHRLPPEIFVLEIGVGSGLRAGLWLDRFKALDLERGRLLPAHPLPAQRLFPPHPGPGRGPRPGAPRRDQPGPAGRPEPVPDALLAALQDPHGAPHQRVRHPPHG